MAKCLELTTAKVIYGRCMLVLTVMREVIELRYSKMLRDNDDEGSRLADFGTLYFRPVVSSFFLLLSSFFPRLISAVEDWMSTILPHMMWP